MEMLSDAEIALRGWAEIESCYHFNIFLSPNAFIQKDSSEAAFAASPSMQILLTDNIWIELKGIDRKLCHMYPLLFNPIQK